MDRIPTGEALRKKNVHFGEVTCRLCNCAGETSEHVFIGCYVASNVWNGISKWCKIPNIFAFSLKDLFGVHMDLRASEKKKDAVQGIMIIACWSLWRARNNLIFSNCPIKIASILSEIKVLGFLWFFNRSKYKGIGWEEWCSFVNM
ncbi:putative reverse transcriptase zinc-binding domain-containing protein [Helianthus debilis subsp. tardiflorus]